MFWNRPNKATDWRQYLGARVLVSLGGMFTGQCKEVVVTAVSSAGRVKFDLLTEGGPISMGWYEPGFYEFREVLILPQPPLPPDPLSAAQS